MAWRDSRLHRRKLALFLSSIALGIAALVSIGSVADNLQWAVDAETRSLLGADLMVRSRQPFSREVEDAFEALAAPGEAREVRFGSMAFFPQTGESRLVQIRAVSGPFPFYGELETGPPDAADAYQDRRYALVDRGLMIQYDRAVGDTVRIGGADFVIGGSLLRIPGETSVSMTAAPPIYIPGSALTETGLIQPGSLVNYRAYFRLVDASGVPDAIQQVKLGQETEDLTFETVADRRRQLNRSLRNLNRFLELAGFAALMLGCLGVGSSVHVYARQKLDSAAVLRCLGARASRVFAVYGVQIWVMSLAGSAAGGLLGIGIQKLTPGVVAPLVPVAVPSDISWGAVGEGMAIGLGLAMLVTLAALMPIRRASPLGTLRTPFEWRDSDAERRPFDGERLAAAALFGCAIAGLAVLHTGSLRTGLGFSGGIAVAFAALSGIALALMRFLRYALPASWSYVWRQGMANLYRPQNQTTVLMLSLGLGTFLIATLSLAQDSLIREVELSGSAGKPNLVLFDVQVDQVDDVVGMLNSRALPVIHHAPVVSMRLSRVGDRSVESLLADTSRDVSRWSLTREYRSTYRDHLFDSEEVVEGAWNGRPAPANGPSTVSLASRIARALKVSPGDSLTFDVQGILIETIIGSIRDVDWQRVQPNFFVVFPTGVLEAAPQFHVMTTRVQSDAESAALQRSVVQTFSNVSVLDLGLVLETVDRVLSQVGAVVRFMALFSLVTGAAVVASTVLTSRFLRVRESILLRAMGASRRQIRQILFVEYLFLGGLAALSGLTLAVCAGWALASLVFDVAFGVPVGSLALLGGAVTILTVLLGLLGSRGVAGRPPLEVLRIEV